jgi:hypothetical protein
MRRMHLLAALYPHTLSRHGFAQFSVDLLTLAVIHHTREDNVKIMALEGMARQHQRTHLCILAASAVDRLFASAVCRLALKDSTFAAAAAAVWELPATIAAPAVARLPPPSRLPTLCESLYSCHGPMYMSLRVYRAWSQTFNFQMRRFFPGPHTHVTRIFAREGTGAGCLTPYALGEYVVACVCV